MSATTSVPVNSQATPSSNYHGNYQRDSVMSSHGTNQNSESTNNALSPSSSMRHQTNHQHCQLPTHFASLSNYQQQNLIEIKSKFEAEFRRFSLQRSEITNLDDFVKLIEHFHKLFTIPFCLFYTDPNHGDLLPINNDTNFALAIASAKPLLRLIVQRKGESIDYLNNYGKKKTNFLGNILPVSSSSKNRLAISAPEDFRQVSSIIDVDIVPETCRRVRLVKHGSDKPLGFYIRDGSSFRITEHGLEKVPGIFISRLVPGGLAESTGLLAVNDEVLEVNGIEVNGKSLDQVTDMMVANSSNLIITIRPANQRAQHHGHHTLSSSYSSNTISNYHPAASMHGSASSDRHHNHHHHNVQQYTNSLERSGHRSKVPDYYNLYSGRQDTSSSHHHPYLYRSTSSEVIEDDDDDEDEDEVRDHFNCDQNAISGTNIIPNTSSTSTNSKSNQNVSDSDIVTL